MSNKQSAIWKLIIFSPVILLLLLGLLVQALVRKMQGKPLSVAKLILNDDEMNRLAMAVKAGEAIFVNGSEKKLKPFHELFEDARGKAHSEFEIRICDDSAHLCLDALRRDGDSFWEVTSLKSILFGVVDVDVDLSTLRIGVVSIGKTDR